MKRTFLIATVVLFAILAIGAKANNLQISNVSLTGQNTGSDYVMVEFDISWDNSWRTDDLNGDGVTNWDAAWIFIKYEGSDGNYYHATLNATDGNHDAGSQGASATVDAASDGMGVFYHRSGNGTGSFSSTDVQLRWEYGTDGLSDDLDSDVTTVEVFAIEMVYVPEGSFYIGDGNGTNESMYAFHEDGVDNTAIQITTIAVDITCDANGNDDIDDTPISVDGDGGITGNADYPTGYNAFYCMKYEITQEQYVDFLNTLTRAQQNTRTGTDISGTSITNRYVMANNSAMQYRNGIRCDATLHATDPITFYCDYNSLNAYNQSDDGQNIACNWLSWADGAAYADWSGLRPMTELEFEKACRGGANAVYGEYAWGTTSVQEATGISNPGNNNETPSNGAANCIYNNNGSVQGPLRGGSCTSGTRSSMGASYYGIMEMSGNLWERSVSIGRTEGRAFTGINGNGDISDAVTNWPSGATAVGSGFRGGSWSNNSIYLPASDRNSASAANGNRFGNFGFRGVRSGG